MANQAQTKQQIVRSAATGQFIGRTRDGIAIARPAFRPESFTVRQLERAIRAVKARNSRLGAV
jgi:hypothetical protein